MKRLLGLLLAGVALCALTGWFVYHRQTRVPPAEWLAKRFELEGPALAAFLDAHARHTSACSETCRRILEADRALAVSVLQSDRVTSDIRDAIARSAGIDAECRANMLAHFYEAAALIPAARREEYLRLVLPLVLRGSMNMELREP